jgi:hypothetical protein
MVKPSSEVMGQWKYKIEKALERREKIAVRAMV